jgi:hypothetical protein
MLTLSGARDFLRKSRRSTLVKKTREGTFFVSPIAVPAIEMQKEMSALSNKFEDTHLFSHLLSVPPAKLITNSFLRDLDKIWALRFIIPDPKKHKWILNDVL